MQHLQRLRHRRRADDWPTLSEQSETRLRREAEFVSLLKPVMGIVLLLAGCTAIGWPL